VGVVEAKTLIDFLIGPELGALPELHADRQREVEGLAARSAS